jgi:hypothetical protein
MGLARLEGPHALSKGGKRLAERGMGARRPPGRTRAALHEDRCGPSLEALCAAHRKRVWNALALQALAGYAIPPPWRPQATPTLVL